MRIIVRDTSIYAVAAVAALSTIPQMKKSELHRSDYTKQYTSKGAL